MAVSKAQTIEQELQAILSSATKDDDGEILRTVTAVTWESVRDNNQTIAQIVDEARPVGKAGSVSFVESTSYAEECARFQLLLVSKMPFEGQTKTENRKAIPAGTDWLMADVRTKAAVKSFQSEIIDQVAQLKWMTQTGGKAKDFPFIKSVNYFFLKLRREILPAATLELYGMTDTTPNERVTANRAIVNVAAKLSFKLLDGVKIYPKNFQDATSARDDLNKIIARAQVLLGNITESMNVATATNGEATGTEG